MNLRFKAESEWRYLLLLSFLNWCIATVTCIRKLLFVHVAFLRAQTQNFRNESAFNWKLCKRQTSELLNHFQLMLLGVSIAETKTVKISKVFASSLPINMHFLLLKSSYGNSKGKRKIINNARLRCAMLKGNWETMVKYFPGFWNYGSILIVHIGVFLYFHTLPFKKTNKMRINSYSFCRFWKRLRKINKRGKNVLKNCKCLVSSQWFFQ